MSGQAKKDQPPKGAEHQPPAVKAHKDRRLRASLDALSPRRTGSAAQQRRKK